MCLNVTKCHVCHAKQSNATCETSKSDPFCQAYHRHGHTGIARTVSDGCGRLRAVADGWATSSEHTLNPQTPRVKREPLLRIREKTTCCFNFYAALRQHQWVRGKWEAGKHWFVFNRQSVTIGHRVLDCFVATKSHQQSYYPKMLLNSNPHFKRRSLNSSAGTLGVMGQFRWIRLTWAEHSFSNSTNETW